MIRLLLNPYQIALLKYITDPEKRPQELTDHWIKKIGTEGLKNIDIIHREINKEIKSVIK